MIVFGVVALTAAGHTSSSDEETISRLPNSGRGASAASGRPNASHAIPATAIANPSARTGVMGSSLIAPFE